MSPKVDERLLSRLQELAAYAVQGSLVEVMVRCGKTSCACHDDPSRRHGPHLYLQFRGPKGRSTSRYIPRTHETQVRQAVDAWAEIGEVLLALGRDNREALVGQIRGKARA
jgi:hypothetical protein